MTVTIDKKYIVQRPNGKFVSAKGGLTTKLAKALTFNTKVFAKGAINTELGESIRTVAITATLQ